MFLFFYFLFFCRPLTERGLGIVFCRSSGFQTKSTDNRNIIITQILFKTAEQIVFYWVFFTCVIDDACSVRRYICEQMPLKTPGRMENYKRLYIDWMLKKAFFLYFFHLHNRQYGCRNTTTRIWVNASLAKSRMLHNNSYETLAGRDYAGRRKVHTGK